MGQDDIFEIELSSDNLFEHICVDEYFYLQEVKQRKLYLVDDIDQNTIDGIIRFIILYNSVDKGVPRLERKPIVLYISSCGGDVDAGFALIDAIEASKTPVVTVNIGRAYSMGFLTMLAGHERYATKNAKFLLHDGTNVVWDSGAKAQDRMKFDERVEKRIREYVLSRTSITREDYEKNYRVEWYMFAEEAQNKGVIHYIIGQDADIDEVV